VHADRLGLLVDQEWTRRQDARLRRRLEHAQFRHGATMEDLDFTAGRGIDRRLVLQLATGEFLLRRLNVIVSGPTGVGKTYLACAMGRSVCKAGFTVRYERLSGLLHRIRQAHGEGSWCDLVRSLSRIQLLVIDDWLRDPVTPGQARDLAEILDDRYQSASTLLATQVPVTEWHARLGDQDAADGILDRIIHNAYRIEMTGESQRKLRSPLRISAATETQP
jgi:DNA replication protein DnaC